MVEYQVAVVICILIAILPIVSFYALRPFIRQRVLKRLAGDRKITFPPELAGFILFGIVGVAFALSGLATLDTQSGCLVT